MYGGARGGGKTDAGFAFLTRYSDHPLCRALVIRKNSDDLSDWIDRARLFYPHATITGKPAIIKFPSGATIRTGHLKDDQAYTKYQGHEYPKMVIEELTQIPSEESYLKLISSCRSTVEGLEPEVFATANPGGKGHAWVKRRFVDGGTSNKPFRDAKSGRMRIFIPATIDDNITLMEADPEYVSYLDSLPEPLRSAWRDGNWDIYAGQYFTVWDADKMHISEKTANDMGYRKHYNRDYIGIDWGFSAPFVALWCNVTPNGTVFFDKELTGRERTPMDWGRDVELQSRNRDVFMSLGDPSMWIRNPMSWKREDVPQHSEASIANALSDSGAPNLVPANNNRINGWMNMALLMQRKRFFIIEGTCPNLVRTIPEQQRDEKNPEDIDKNGDDHWVDAARYALTHVQAPPPPAKVKPMLQRQYEELIMPEEKIDSDYNWSNI